MDNVVGKIKTTILNGKCSLLLVGILVLVFWYPALFQGKTIIHGDSVHHGLPLFYTHKQLLSDSESVLWSNKIYGGHPLFAEGQGGYANPLNILIAFFFNLNFGHQLVYLLAMVIGGAGVFVLGRQLKLSYWSATFAALATAFSTAWISVLYNYTGSSTLTWAPWMLVACEYWLKRPSAVSALLLAIPTAFSILAGYPQFPYGVVVYMIASMLPLPFASETKGVFKSNWKKYLLTGSLAVLIFIGMTAMQTLPLIELVGQSHRNHGIKLAFTGIDFIYWFRGLLFTYALNEANPISAANVANLGSLMVFCLALGSLFVKMPVRIMGHIIASFLLINLGMQDASPIFNFIYTFHLIPGLHYYRIMHVFLDISVIGISILAGFFVDSVSKNIIPFWAVGKPKKYLAALILLLLAFFLIPKSVECFTESASVIQVLTFLIAFVFIFLLRKASFARVIPVLLVLVLFTECLLLRTKMFHFAPGSIVAPPKETVDHVLSDPLIHEYKTHTGAGPFMFFMDPRHPALESGFKRFMSSLPCFPGLMWGLSSIDGALALKLGRRSILDPVFEEEIFQDQNEGFKMMDILGLKYIVANKPVRNPAMQLLYFDRTNNIKVYINRKALPRFQIYTSHVFVDSYEEALMKIKSAEEKTLYLERPEEEKIRQISFPETQTLQNFTEKMVLENIQYVEKSSQRYELTLDTPRAAWLFLADANYPGWEAKINGMPTTVYSAQVLGKAIRINPGKNHIIIEYVPRMFYIGLVITAMTLLFALFLLIRQRRQFSPLDRNHISM